jgi:hypothetical protein
VRHVAGTASASAIAHSNQPYLSVHATYARVRSPGPWICGIERGSLGGTATLCH